MSVVKDIADIIPVQLIENSCIFCGSGDVTIGFAIIWPESHHSSVDSYNNLYSQLNAFISQQNSGTVIHKLDFYYKDAFTVELLESDNFLQKSMKELVNYRPILRHTSYLFFTMPLPAKVERSSSETNFFSRQNFSTKPIFALDKVKLGDIKNFVNSVSNGIQSIIGLSAFKLNNDQLIIILDSYYNLSYSKPARNIDNCSWGEMFTDANVFRKNNQYVSILSVKSEGNMLDIFNVPQNIDPASIDSEIKVSQYIGLPNSMMYPICMGFPANHIVSTSIEILDSKTVDTFIFKENLAFKQLAKFHPDAQKKIDEYEVYKDSLTADKGTSARVCLSIIMHHKEKDQLSNLVSLMQSAASKINSLQLIEETSIDSANLFICNTPGYMRYNYRPVNILTSVEHGLAYWVKETSFRSDKSGLLFIDRNGSPVVVDTWNLRKGYNNRNGIIIGPSGAGKSVLMNYILNELVCNNNYVVVADMDGSYKKLINVLNGKYYDTRELKSLTFAPFIINVDKIKGKLNFFDLETDDRSHATIFILTLIVNIFKNGVACTTDEKVILQDSIAQFYKYCNDNDVFPDFNCYASYLDYFNEYAQKEYPNLERYFDINSLKICLKPFIKGGVYENLLNAQVKENTIDVKFIAYDLAGVSEAKEIFNLVSVLLTESVVEKFRKLPDSKKSFFIDEGLDFLKADVSTYIGGLYRKARKFNGQVVLATQNLEFLDSISKEVRDSIIGNSGMKIIMVHTENKEVAFKSIQNFLSVTSDGIDLIRSLRIEKEYREFFIMLGSSMSVLRLELTEEYYATFTSTREETAEIEKNFRKFNSMETAIYQFIENKNNLKLKSNV